MAEAVDQFNDDFDFGPVPEMFSDTYEGPLGMFLLEFKDMGEVEVQEKYQNEAKTRKRAWFEFEIVGNAMGDPDPSWDGETVRVFMNISLWPTSSLRPCVDALCGGEMPVGFRPSKNRLVGKRAFGVIRTEPKQDDPTKRKPVIEAWTPYNPDAPKPTRKNRASAEAVDPANPPF